MDILKDFEVLSLDEPNRVDNIRAAIKRAAQQLNEQMANEETVGLIKELQRNLNFYIIAKHEGLPDNQQMNNLMAFIARMSAKFEEFKECLDNIEELLSNQNQ